MADRESYWRDVLAQWRASGLSRAAFCRRRGVSYQNLTYWKSRLEARQPTAPSPAREARTPTAAKFVEVPVQRRPAPVASAPFYELVLLGGRTLRVPAGFDAGEVTRLVAVAEAC